MLDQISEQAKLIDDVFVSTDGEVIIKTSDVEIATKWVNTQIAREIQEPKTEIHNRPTELLPSRSETNRPDNTIYDLLDYTSETDSESDLDSESSTENIIVSDDPNIEYIVKSYNLLGLK